MLVRIKIYLLKGIQDSAKCSKLGVSLRHLLLNLLGPYVFLYCSLLEFLEITLWSNRLSMLFKFRRQ